MKIITPVCSINEIEPVINAGADEVYFGIMTKKWVEQYGNGDLITRRQSEWTHFTSFEDLSDIVSKTNEQHCLSILTLNARYSTMQLPYIYEIIEQWEEQGGQAVMVSDIELLLWLNEYHPKLIKHLSVMAGVFNSQSVRFFEQFNVSRFVLPREMTVSEMAQLIKNAPKPMEFEAIVMFQKCPFIDSFCNFSHTFNYQPFIVDDYSGDKSCLPVLESDDPCNSEHGCRMTFFCKGKKIRPVDNDDLKTPFCAACAFDQLLKAGVSHFKIAGRGFPVEWVTTAVRFVRQIIETENIKPAQIKEKYKSAFGRDCSLTNCYYT